jgi:hypothetical protein
MGCGTLSGIVNDVQNMSVPRPTSEASTQTPAEQLDEADCVGGQVCSMYLSAPVPCGVGVVGCGCAACGWLAQCAGLGARSQPVSASADMRSVFMLVQILRNVRTSTKYLGSSSSLRRIL